MKQTRPENAKMTSQGAGSAKISNKKGKTKKWRGTGKGLVGAGIRERSEFVG